MIIRIATMIAAFFLATSPRANAQIFIEHIAPPAIEKGKTTRITFVGKHLDGALDVWNSLPAGSLKIKAIESNLDRAVFDIEATSTAPVGICGLRVATRDGLSNAHLFLIDDLPVKPREQSSEIMKAALPIAVWDTFHEAQVDRYQIEATAGQRVSFEVVGNRFGRNADPLLTIRDSRGKWIAEHDNDQGLYYDCRFEHQFKDAGSYIVEVRDARFEGSPHRSYVLRMGRFPASRVAVPSAVQGGRNDLLLPEIGATVPYEFSGNAAFGPFMGALRRADDQGSTWLPLTTTAHPITVARQYDEARTKAQAPSITPPVTLCFNLSPLRANPFLSLERLVSTGTAQATLVKIPGVLCGVLKTPGERHAFMFELAKGQSVSIRGEAQVLNSPADLDMVLTDSRGREVKRPTEPQPPLRGEPTIEYTANAPGTFCLHVRDLARDGGNAFTYRLTVNDKHFPPSLVAEVEGISISQGSYQPIPITVTRTGPATPIKLKLLNAPPGVKLTPDEIDEKTTAIVCKLEAGPAAPVGISAIQILAESDAGSTLVRTQPLVDKQLVNVDLIPYGLREDQRRLPPSLNDRFAVQVVPPAPFTMDLPESAVTLPRYQHVEFPIVTTRQPGFDGPITFHAKGGQLANKKEGRTRVYAEFVEATPKQPTVNGAIHSKILANLAKARIEVTGTGVYQGRQISVTRTFELTITTAFTFVAEPAKVALLPGESTKVKMIVTREKTFDGEVEVKLSPMPGIHFPEVVMIPKGQTSAEFTVAVPADATARRQGLQMNATGFVGGFEEQVRGAQFEIEVKKVEVPKKVEVKKEAPKKK